MDGTGTSRINLLLVEDDAAHAKLFRRAVREFEGRLTVNHVGDGRAALAAVAANDGARPGGAFDIVVLDLRLPSVDGFEVLRQIRSDARTRGLPVVVVSTSDRPEEIERCYHLGANAYMCKPVNFREMLEKLRSLALFWMHVATLPEPRRRAG